MKHDWKNGRCARCRVRYVYPTPGPCPAVTLRRAARERLRGVHTFYVTSLSGRDGEYTLKVIRRPGRRTTTCTCPDYTHREFPLRRTCKHVRLLREFLRRTGGLRSVPLGATVTVPPGRTLVTRR